MIDKIILGFLHWREATGYDIKKYMENSTKYFYSASYGSINPALRKLEKKGLVTSTETVENGRMKRVYSINDEGRKTFRSWLMEDISPSPAKEESLLRMFFYSRLDEDEAQALIERYIESVRAERQELLELKKVACKYHEDIGSAYETATLLFGIDYYEFVEKWYTDFLEKRRNR